MTTTKTTTPAAIAAAFLNHRGEVVGIDECPHDGGLQLTFGDGTTTLVRLADLSAAMMTACAWHGLKQKAVDAGAISRNPETGRPATVADKKAAVLEVIDRVLRGEWFKVRGDGSGGSSGLLYRALCRMYAATMTPEQVRAKLDSLTDAEQAAMRRNPKVAAVIEAIRAESAKADSVDSDALLAGFGG